MAVDRERIRLDQEKIRVQNLLQGMQNVMNTYNSSFITPPLTSQNINYGITSSGYGQYNTPSVMPVSLLGNKRVECENFSTPLASQAITGKRKGPEVSVVAPPVSRKPRTTTAQEKSYANEANKMAQADKTANNLSSQTVANNSAATNELMTGDVSKCLFNKADSSIPTNSTPQKHASSPGSDKSNSPQKELEVTPTNCPIVTKERFTISPLKQITSYSVERSHLVSSSSPVQSNLKISNRRDHVRGRLNFDDTDTEKCLEAPATAAPLVATSPSGSDPEVDLFDMDLFDMEFLGENFSISEMLVDFDLACEGSTLNAPIETPSGLSPELGNCILETDQTMSEYTTMNEVIQGKDMSTQGGRLCQLVHRNAYGSRVLLLLAPKHQCKIIC
ncbi:unnamed protein product [Arabis nemorensis]|uniref:Uncharacterized protein n=1 Tax=Arabis nemorensis TaxID=586526 RepID=A0A565BW51_9BRAS|nr:unnamed protein product [Arabis nemorensis]